MIDLGDRLAAIEQAGLYRQLRSVSSAQSGRITLDVREVILLCSNNYLGLADHPKLIAAAVDATERYGTSAGASRLVCGNMVLHDQLERRLAEFVGSEAVLTFGSGFLLNSGVIPALAPAGTVIFSDELNHASIIEGSRLAKAESFIYRHSDLEHLETGLRQAGRKATLIVTDSVFSMDGDLAPLAEIVELASRYKAIVVVDEAHAIGAIGPGGRGLVAKLGLTKEVDIVVGTLGKALGSYGAFACCSCRMREYLINTARTLIFSTGLPPGPVAAAKSAIEIVAANPDLVAQLQTKATLLKDGLIDAGLTIGPTESQIIPLVVGEADKAMELCDRALEKGVFAQAIRPPTVPQGSSRIRITPMASHSEQDLLTAADAFKCAAKEVALIA